MRLLDICDYVTDKIDIENVHIDNYVSTDNMIANKAGIMSAISMPKIKKVQAFKENDILVSNIRPYFKKIWQATAEGGCSNDVLVFRAKKKIESKYLYYILSDDRFFEYAMLTSKGTKMPRGDKKALMEYKVPDFEYSIQRKISLLLSNIDRKIEVNNAINNNLEQQAKALFHSLFVDNANPTWKDGVLSDIGTIVAGGTPSKSKPEYYSEHGIAWITPKDLSLNKSKFISHGETDISELGFSKSSATKMPAGTVLFSSRAPIGYIAIAANEVTTNQGFKSVVPNENVGTAFMYYLLKWLLPTIERMSSGSTFKEISGAGMKAVPVIIPDNETIENFNAFCVPIFQQQEILEAENFRLSNIRDTLLPKLMSGELDVSNIDL